MAYPKILTVQDISCLGQCSLTVALPVISACGVETCVLPSAVLSTHTGGFSGFTFRDLTEDMPAIGAHWMKEGIAFDAVYTGYLGSTKQIDYVADIMDSVATDDCVKIVDPAMADNGALYYGFDSVFVDAMKHTAWHQHAGRPNFTAYYKGEPIVIDSGCTSYDRENLRNNLASVSGHNAIYTKEGTFISCQDVEEDIKITEFIENKKITIEGTVKAKDTEYFVKRTIYISENGIKVKDYAMDYYLAFVEKDANNEKFEIPEYKF